MNSDDLELFAKVAHHRSIVRVALELGMDQSTITRHIARLEQQSGLRLFYRNGRGVVLTDAGKAFLQPARKVLESLEQARLTAHALSHAGPPRLSIAAPPTIAGVLFGRMANAVAQAFPATVLHFAESLVSNILNMLAEGEVDIGVVYAPVPASLTYDSLMLKESIYLVGPATAPPLGAEVLSTRIGEFPLLLPATPYGSRMMAETLARNLGLQLNIRLECNTGSATMKHLVEEGIGYSLMPYAIIDREITHGRLQAARLIDPPVTRDIVVVTARNRDPAPELWNTLQIMRNEIKHLVQAGRWPGVALSGDNIH